MSKAPKRPNQRNNPKQQEDEGGAPRSSRASTRKPQSAPKRKAATTLDTLSPETDSGAVVGSEGNVAASIPPAQDDTRAKARNLIAEGDQKSEGQQGLDREIRDVGNPQAQPLASAGAIHREDANQTGESNLVQSAFGVEDKADQIQVLSERSPIAPITSEVRSESLEDAENPAHPGPDSEMPRVTAAGTQHLEAASEPVGIASGRVKVWSQDRTTHRAQQADESGEPTNPIYILAAITLGIPALALIALVGMNPSVEGGTLMTFAKFLVISAFTVAAVFEIKRLADHH